MATAHSPIRHRAGIVLTLLLVALLGWGAVAVVTGRYQIRPVLSGSMEPGLPTGGIVITERIPISALHVRDVVVIHPPNHPDEMVVHRIIALTQSASGVVVQTQGDANTVPDAGQATLQGTTAYRAVFALPLIGYASVWAHGPTGRLALIVFGLLLVLFALVSGLRQRHRPTSSAAQPRHRQAAESVVTSLTD
jgi:signal peptidase I